jgi:protein-disulfide isomerase
MFVFIGIFAITQHSSSNGSGGGSKSSSSQVSKNIEGQGSSGVTLQEYGDYQCPICGSYYQPLKDATTPLLPQIFFQFSNLPLTSIHPNAFAAARAAQAAGLQNKYWQMHDTLYENQQEGSGWTAASDPLNKYFVGFAKQIGLDTNKFKQDYASSQVNDVINADLAAFAKTGKESATPTFFLDGQYIDNSQFSDPQTGRPSAAKITQVLQAAINKKQPAGSSAATPSQ